MFSIYISNNRSPPPPLPVVKNDTSLKNRIHVNVIVAVSFRQDVRSKLLMGGQGADTP